MNGTEERKQLKDALKGTKKAYRDLIDTINEVVYVIDTEGVITFVSPNIEKKSGYTAEELIGRRYFELIHEEDLSIARNNFEKSLSGVVEPIEFRLVSKSGEYVRVRTNRQPIIKDNRFAGIQGVLVDITARKQADDLYRTISERSFAGVYIAQDGKFLFVNSNAARYAGYTREEMVGMNLESIVFPEDRGKVRENSRAMLSGKRTHPYEFRILTKEGSVRWIIEAVNSVIYEGTPAVLGNYMDITDIESIRSDLRESEERNRALVEAYLNLVFTVDRRGMFTYVNPAFERETGYRKSELMGRPFTCVVLPERKLSIVRRFKMSIRGKKIPPYKTELVRKDGTKIPVEFIVVTIYDSNGNARGRYGIGRNLTERRQAQEELRESERKLKTILEGFPIPAFVIDGSHTITYWNKALEEMSGLKADDMIGTCEHWRAFYKDERPCMVDLLVDKRFDELSRWYEGKYKSSSLIEGSYEAIDYFSGLGTSGKWLRFTATLLKKSEGMIAGALETLEDITENVRTDMALKQAEGKYRSIFENAVEGIFQSSPEGRILSANPSLARIFGYDSPEDLIDTVKDIRMDIYVDSEDRDTFICLLEEKGVIQEFEFRAYKKNGNVVWVSENVQAVRNGKGKLLYYEGTIEDISNRKRMEEALRKSEEKFRTISASAHDAIVMINDEGNVTFWNEAAESIFEYSIDEIIGREFHTLLAPQRYQEAYGNGFNEFKTTGTGVVVGQTLELEAVRKDGTEFPVELSVSATQFKGKWTAIGIIRDITDRKRAEELLADNREHLRLINRIIQHDITNDLSVIRSALSLYGTSRNEELLAEASNRVGRSIELISRMKELETYISNKRGLRFLNVEEVVREVMKNHAGIDFTIEGTGQVLADEAFGSVIENIVSNASIHGKTERIDVSIEGIDAFCEIRIADHGIGIPDDMKERIFDEGFFYGERGNSGLGLNIVKKAMEGYGGFVYAEDNTPRGAVFVLRLRRVR